MSARLAQQDRQRKLAARDMMEREWGPTAEPATHIAQPDLLITNTAHTQT